MKFLFYLFVGLFCGAIIGSAIELLSRIVLNDIRQEWPVFGVAIGAILGVVLSLSVGNHHFARAGKAVAFGSFLGLLLAVFAGLAIGSHMSQIAGETELTGPYETYWRGKAFSLLIPACTLLGGGLSLLIVKLTEKRKT